VWMIVSSRAISRIATILNKTEDAQKYQAQVTEFTDVLNQNFWDESRQMYDDIYIDESGNKVFDNHTGYLNFWPLFLYAIDPKDERFEITMKKLIDPDFGLWTPFGISSLSKYDPYYKMGDNYWTSPIWMNINFLIVKALFDYSNNQDVEITLRGQIKDAY
jgi:mannosyl-oligosaccharide glucosidase